MRPVAFYRHQTDFLDPRFGLSLVPKGEVFLPFYMHLRHALPDSSDPRIPGLTVLRASAPDLATLPREVFVKRMRSRNRQKIDPEMVPDLWTGIEIPIVSDRFLEILGTGVDTIGEFVPIRIYDITTDKIIEKDFFMLFCHTVARVEASSYEALNTVTDYRWMIPKEAELLATILKNKIIVDFLQSRTLWVLYERPDILFFTGQIMKDIRSSRLVGFSEHFKNKFAGDISHVWATAPSPDPRVAAGDEAAALTAPSRSAASVAS